VVDAVARQLAHHPAEIGRRDVQLVGIETDLSLAVEILAGEGKEDLKDVLLVTEVGSGQTAVERQLADKEQADVDEGEKHLLLIDMGVVDCVLDLLEDATKPGQLFLVEMEEVGRRIAQIVNGDIAASKLELTLIDLVVEQQAFALHGGREVAVDRLERVDEKQVAPAQGYILTANGNAGLSAMDEMKLMAADAVGDGTQVALPALCRRIVGDAATEDAAYVISLSQLRQT